MGLLSDIDLQYVQGLSADGGTNINDALKKSLELVKEKNEV